MSDYPMLISNKLHSFRNFSSQMYSLIIERGDKIVHLRVQKYSSPKKAEKTIINKLLIIKQIK